MIFCFLWRLFLQEWAERWFRGQCLMLVNEVHKWNNSAQRAESYTSPRGGTTLSRGQGLISLNFVQR